MQPRVLHVCQPTVDGAPNVLLELVADQVSRGWKVSVAGPSTFGYLLERSAELGAEVEPWEATRSPGPQVAGEVIAFRRIVDSVSPDVVHLHSSKAGLVGRLAIRRSRPTIFQPHAWSYDAVQGGMRQASLRWEQMATRWTSLTICVSKAEYDTGKKQRTLATASAVIPNGVDTERLAPQERHSCRASLGLPADNPLVLCIGRITRQKGQDVLLDAWGAITEAVPGAQLALVGDGPDKQALMARNVPGVCWYPNQQPNPWYGAADLVVLPSRWEGMPLVLLEAMSSARSVVASNVTGIADATGPGDHLLPPDDAPRLAAAIIRRLADPALRESEGRALRERAVSEFGVQRTASRVAELTMGLLQEH